MARAAIHLLTGRWAAVGRGAGGRPLAYWADGSGSDVPDFSISYAGGYVGVAVAERGRVGIDIEPSCSIGERVARRVMSPSDLVCFDLLSPRARRVAATRYWTCTEALVKADGNGLPQMLTRSRDLGFGADGECGSFAFAVRGTEDGLVCALAAECADDLGYCVEAATRSDAIRVIGPLAGENLTPPN